MKTIFPLIEKVKLQLTLLSLGKDIFFYHLDSISRDKAKRNRITWTVNFNNIVDPWS